MQDLVNPLLDPAHLDRIKDLALLARVAVEGNFFGLHRSRNSGRGIEFFQYRAYEPGEDIKSVDWKVFAKSGSLLSKTYQDSTNSNLIIVLDASASMEYKSEDSVCSKFRYAQMLASCLIYLGHRQGDRVGFFGGSESFQEWMFPNGGNESFKNILTHLAGMIPQGSDMEDLYWDKFKSKLPKQATVVIISDFLENESKLSERLNFALSSRYQCLCLQILDPLEETLPDAQAVRFMELEGKGEISVSPEQIRIDYQDQVKKHIKKLNSILSGTGSEFHTLRTNMDLGQAIRNFLLMRRSLK